MGQRNGAGVSKRFKILEYYKALREPDKLVPAPVEMSPEKALYKFNIAPVLKSVVNKYTKHRGEVLSQDRDYFAGQPKLTTRKHPS